MRKTGRPALGILLLLLAATAATAAPVQIDALYGNDATEATLGVFLPKNFTSALFGTAPFAQLRLQMRPVTVSGGQAGGSVTVASSSGGVILAFTTSGTPVSLPATFPTSSLPLTLLIHGEKYGASKLLASDGVSEDLLVFQVRPFPGLAGRPLKATPHFEYVRALNQNGGLYGALDPTRAPDRIGRSFEAYVVAHRAPAEWAVNATLTDLSNDGPDAATVGGVSLEFNTWKLWTSGLVGDAGELFGVSYDVVFDFGGDGRLDPGDLIDRLDPQRAGVYVVDDPTTLGPRPFASFELDDPDLFLVPAFQGAPTYSARSRGLVVYPTDIEPGKIAPLVTFSHGNTGEELSYLGYRYLQEMLASHGYITASFDMFPAHGVSDYNFDPYHRAWLTLRNIERMVLQSGPPRFYPPMGHGVLEPKGLSAVDGMQIMSSGHSRGGEAVVLAASQLRHLFDPNYSFPGIVPPGETIYGFESIVGLHDIAGTNFNAPSDGNSPFDTPYVLFWDLPDLDVIGVDPDIQPTRRYGQATGERGFSMHYDVTHGCYNEYWQCYDSIGFMTREEVEAVALGYLQPFVQRVLRGAAPSDDFYARSASLFRPIGTESIDPSNDIVQRWRRSDQLKHFTIDDYETEHGTGTSSSGGPVTYTVAVAEDDANWWGSYDAALSWSGASQYYELALIAAHQDLRADAWLSFSIAQLYGGETSIALEVTLRDVWGDSSTINLKTLGGVNRHYGIQPEWDRTSYQTFRLRPTDFEANRVGKLDLARIVAVRFSFGTAHGSPASGQVVLDDVELLPGE